MTELRQYIKDSGMTYYRLSKLSGVSQAAIGRFMKGGDLRSSNLEKLLSILNMSLVRGNLYQVLIVEDRGADRLYGYFYGTIEEVEAFCREKLKSHYQIIKIGVIPL